MGNKLIHALKCYIQLLKLKKIKCPYFLDQTSYNWDMSFLYFLNACPYVPYQISKLKITNSSYLSFMMSDPKNEGTLFSSTLKVGERKVLLFLWSEFILVSYGHFVVSWRHPKTPQKSQNDKKLISPSNDVRSKK